MTHRPDLGKKFQSRYKEVDWLLKKESKLIQANHQCQKCEASITMTTSVCHHISYRGFNDRNERMSELQILCRPCHDRIEARKDKNRKHKRAGKLFAKKVEIAINSWNNDQTCDNKMDDMYEMDAICHEVMEQMRVAMAEGKHRWPGWMFQVYGSKYDPNEEGVWVPDESE